MMKYSLLYILTISALVIAGCNESTSSGYDENDDNNPIIIDDSNSSNNEADSVYTNSIGMTFVLVEAGEFQMGSNSGNVIEQPVHSVTISENYYMGIVEVTQLQWQQIMGTNNSFFRGDSLPVERVSFDDIQTFIEELNSAERGAGYRLPTEAEWEYAARGGHKSNAYLFAGSNDLVEVAWFAQTAEGRTHNVGQKKPNELGIYDMSGNVWEWCNDWFNAEYYTNSPIENPQGPETGVNKVLRGGSWGSEASQIQVFSRNSIEPNSRFSGIGFRLLRSYP